MELTETRYVAILWLVLFIFATPFGIAGYLYEHGETINWMLALLFLPVKVPLLVLIGYFAGRSFLKRTRWFIDVMAKARMMSVFFRDLKRDIKLFLKEMWESA